MPIKLNKESDTGEIATYHVIGGAEINFQLGVASAFYFSYIDKAAFDEAKSPVDKGRVDISGLLLLQSASPLLSQIEHFVLTGTPEFAGGVIVA